MTEDNGTIHRFIVIYYFFTILRYSSRYDDKIYLNNGISGIAFERRVDMWYIKPIADDAAEGVLLELYDQDLKEDGYVSNTTRVWSYRPELATQWLQLIRAIRSQMRLRTYELVVLAASHTIGCVY